jgi:WD40 repeat protein
MTITAESTHQSYFYCQTSHSRLKLIQVRFSCAHYRPSTKPRAPTTSSPESKTPAITPCRTGRDHTARIRNIVHLPGRRRIITCSEDGSLQLWDLESGIQIGDDWRDGASNEVVRTSALSPNGKIVASGTVRMWDVKTGKVIAKWKEHTKSVHSVC